MGRRRCGWATLLFNSLQGVLTLPEGVDDEREVDEAGKHDVEFVEARENAAEPFEPAKESFDFIASAIMA